MIDRQTAFGLRTGLDKIVNQFKKSPESFSDFGGAFSMVIGI